MKQYSSVPKFNSKFHYNILEELTQRSTEVKTSFQKYYYIQPSTDKQLILCNDKIKTQKLKGIFEIFIFTEHSLQRNSFINNLSLNPRIIQKNSKFMDSKSTLS